MKNVEDVYALSPVQQGMLFHTLYDAGSGVYVGQLICSLHGNRNVPAFQQAWQQVVDRHPVLRTAFVWEGLDEPLQIVRRQVRLPWIVEDWRGLPPGEQEARLAAIVADDRRQGFVLSQAPLMRMALLQVADDAYHFVWSQHHLLMDGWALQLVINDVFTCYDAFTQDRKVTLARSRPYRDYIDWLERQDLARAEAFWRHTLAGFTTMTSLGVDHPAGPDDAASYAEQRLPIAESTTAALQALARQHGLTSNTMAQGAWALLLSRYSGETDVLFGA